MGREASEGLSDNSVKENEGSRESNAAKMALIGNIEQRKTEIKGDNQSN